MEFKIILKKINNSLSEKEVLEFNAWYSESREHQAYFEKVKSSKDAGAYLFDNEKNWTIIEKKTPKNNKLKYLIAAAAAVVLIFSVNNLLSLKQKEFITASEVHSKNLQKVILTLNDGENIALGNNTVFEQHNLKSEGRTITYKKVEKESFSNNYKNAIAYNYLTTKSGGEFSLVLKDGTKVWLNSESQIKYPTSFNKGVTRKVELIYGEAYFEVSPSEENFGDGFKVTHSLQEINVVGTHFNIKAYPDDAEVITTLIEGSVSVSTEKREHIILTPNEQLLLNNKSLLTTVKTVDTQEHISWINGYFNFKNLSLPEITKVLSRWYDVEIAIEKEKIGELKFNGVLHKKQNISSILNSIANTSNITFEINGKQIKLKY